MHEISIAESIVQIAEAKAREQNARGVQVKCVQVIKLRLGTFTTIVPEALQFAFEIARQGTLSRNARLDIEMVPMVVRCVVCDAVAEPVRGVCLICAQCGFPLEIVSGEELQIEYIEVDCKEMDSSEGGPPWSQYPNEFPSRPMC